MIKRLVNRYSFKVSSLTLAVTLVLPVIQMIVPSSAEAMAQNCSSSHCYSIRYGAPTAATGVFMNTHANSMTPGGTPSAAFQSFITSEMWLQDPASARWWVEEGLVDGYDAYLSKPVYAYFTFYRNTIGSDSGWNYLAYLTPNGTSHAFQISRAPTSNDWYVFIDGTELLETGNVGFWTGEPVVGGECYCNATNEHADTFNMNTTAEDSAGHVATYAASAYNIHSGENGVDHGTYWAWNAP